MLVTRQKKSLYFFINLKTDHLSYSLYKHDNINIAYPSSMQDMCLLLLNRPQSSWSLWLGGRASECGIWRSEVQFLVGTQILVVTRWKNIFLYFLLSSKLTISLILFTSLKLWKYKKNQLVRVGFTLCRVMKI